MTTDVQADGRGRGDPDRSDTGYRVLARKYRPQNFDDLIGQRAMVQTLKNAFATGRIAQAYMLTGVRGVGKTTTARILARALNYSRPGADDGPMIDMPELGEHCEAIMESRHIDVLEMDAASHTGINDIREIIDSVRYLPVSARYKVYIIDEVHMLSAQAFNGLLKTLEEPPPHVKFVFATTEIRKVPVTVLSRCQRFDLRRVEASEIAAHLRRIADAEKVEVEDAALAAIARASEGSVRDALSLLDQAITHGGGRITAEELREMLGLADRGRVIDLFEGVMRGDAPRALGELGELHEIGADPAVVLSDLAEFVHLVTRMKLAPATTEDRMLSEEERQRGSEFAAKLSIKALSRAWQMLLKGVAEVRASPKPLAAADMVLVRLCYAANLPSPEEALKMLREGESGRGISGETPAPVPTGSRPDRPRALAAPVATPSAATPSAATPSPGAREPEAAGRKDAPVAPARFEDVVELASARRDLPLKRALERNMRLVRFEPGRIEVALTEDAPAGIVHELSNKLAEWTGMRWMVSVSGENGAATLADQKAARHARLISDARADPLVAAILREFPGAEIVDVKITEDEPSHDGVSDFETFEAEKDAGA